MPNRAMARRMAALQLCIDLHRKKEIDDNLLPIGKENFKAKPEDAEVPALPDESEVDFSEARPGTTKRRQYYYKKVSFLRYKGGKCIVRSKICNVTNIYIHNYFEL